MNPAISLIEFYQQYLSPWKGFSCAHRVYHGGHSCSEAVKNIIRDQGLFAGMAKIRQRFRDCGKAARSIRAKMIAKLDGPRIRIDTKQPHGRRKWHDYLDCGVLPCDCGAGGVEAASGCEILGCLSF
ncbi:MAG: membrane protein insertion efficiency factor YidD [Limisphaerales bacterium]